MNKISALVALLFFLYAPPAVAQQEEPGSPRAQAPLTVLQLNDVYSTTPVNDVGGLARIATLKKQLADGGRTPLLIMAGDFLSPSVSSSVFKGAHMVAALNSAGLDLATLGNHEFDFGEDVLIQRMAEAKWTWVVSNVVDRRTNKPIGGAEPFIIRTFGGMKVGFIGLCLTTAEISASNITHMQMIDPLLAARRYLPMLKKRGANVIVAITHLAFDDDRALVTRFPEIDLVIGGHEHYPITSTEGRTLISKAGSDARWVARLDVNRRRDKTVERFYELIPVTSAIPDDPATAEVVKAYEDRLGTALDEVVGETAVPLDATSLHMRAGETNIGNFVADAMRADVGADVAITNAGGIRGDRVYPAGPLSKRTILAIHPLGNVVVKIAATGEVIQAALESGVSRMPAAAGQFPQVSGLTLRVDPAAPVGRRVSDVMIGGKPLDRNATYTIATTDYMMKGGDGYSMFAGQKELVGPESGNLLVMALEKMIAGMKAIAPGIEGRIVIVR
jgi:2',3'-cyclic-nucleotide 2'-phosphodiesterase (5'-nucleotidase family)